MSEIQPQVDILFNRGLLGWAWPARTISTMESHFGTVLKNRLEALEKTQRWLADALGVSDQAVSKWIKTGSISLDHAKEVASLLGVSLDSLVNKEAHPGEVLYQTLMRLPIEDRTASLDYLMYKIEHAQDVFVNEHSGSYIKMIESIVSDMKTKG